MHKSCLVTNQVFFPRCHPQLSSRRWCEKCDKGLLVVFMFLTMNTLPPELFIVFNVVSSSCITTTKIALSQITRNQEPTRIFTFQLWGWESKDSSLFPWQHFKDAVVDPWAQFISYSMFVKCNRFEFDHIWLTGVFPPFVCSGEWFGWRFPLTLPLSKKFL